MPRLLWVTAAPFYPEQVGGADRNYLYLFRALRERGWQIEAMCGLGRRSPHRRTLRRLRRLALLRGEPRPEFVLDDSLGFPCWRGLAGRRHAACAARWMLGSALGGAGVVTLRTSRRDLRRGCAPSWSNVSCSAELAPARRWLDRRLRAYHPDVVLGHMGSLELLDAAVRQGFASFYYIQGVQHLRRGRGYPAGVRLIANSPFVAALASRVSPYAVGTVLSFIERARYEVSDRERRYVTFVNPVPDKGLATVASIARQMPDVRFLVVKGGWFDAAGRLVTRLRTRALTALPNVDVWDFQEDMRRVFAVTDVLLFPSRCDESFGRLVVEAQISGIPVVAANDGGVAYALGQGGVLVDPRDDVAAYVRAIRRLRTDETYHAAVSARAIDNSRRPEFDPLRQVDEFVRLVQAGATP